MKYLATVFIFLSAPAWAYNAGTVFFDPQIGVGHNVAQGTYFMVGADAGYAISEQLAAGIGGFYSAGQRPEHDRSAGGGPFVSFYQPITSFLVASVREDIAYIDQRSPVEITTAGGKREWTHVNEHGVASITSIGLHIILSRSFAISGGYRALFSLSNTDIAKDRSGTFLGIAIGI